MKIIKKMPYFISVSVLSLALLFLVICRPVGAVIITQELEETIVVLDRARSNTVIQLQRESIANRLSDTEIKEYGTFIHYLGGRINYYCRELERKVKAGDLRDLPCGHRRSEEQPEPQHLPLQPDEIVTEQDKADDLESSLQASLGQFDEMLLREQEDIARQQVQKGVLEQSGRQSGDFQGTKGGAAEARKPNNQNGSESTDRVGGAGEGRQKSGEDEDDNRKNVDDEDDIVARQLREAAEKETDPEIKEKLWEEYRKYKKGIN